MVGSFRRVFLAIALLLLLGLSWMGRWDGLHQIRQSHTIGQQAQTIAQIAYGLLSLLGLLTSFRARRWGPLILGCWAVSLSLAAGLASVVWGGTNVAMDYGRQEQRCLWHWQLSGCSVSGSRPRFGRPLEGSLTWR